MTEQHGILDLLVARGFDPNCRAKLVRHQDKRFNISELIRDGWFELYQSTQARSIFRSCDYIVSFMGDGGTRSRLIGVYRVVGERPVVPDDIPEDSPLAHERYRTGYFYDLERQRQYSDLEGRVVIEWGRGAVKWDQYITNKAIIEILPGDPQNWLSNVRELVGSSEQIQQELKRRALMWQRLHDYGGPNGVAPSLLHELKIYGGAAGIWKDTERTSKVAGNDCGVTVSVLHTGKSYADDLSNDDVIYHYPDTNRSGKHDQTEIEATKEAGQMRLPVFVIVYSGRSGKLRDVHLGWVEAWHDESSVFLIAFRERPLEELLQPVADESEFTLTDDVKPKKRESMSRDGQQRFKFQVLRRYGPSCAVCGIDLLEVLDAAHIRPKRRHGSDDPRNGLILCATHHRAFDAGLFSVEPDSMRLVYSASELNALALGIKFDDLNHLRLAPHPEAINWAWNQQKKK